jgi:hypothetical protein
MPLTSADLVGGAIETVFVFLQTGSTPKSTGV